MINNNARRDDKPDAAESLSIVTCPRSPPPPKPKPEPPPPKPKAPLALALALGPQECNEAFDDHDGVHENNLKHWAKWLCQEQGVTTWNMDAGSKPIFWRPKQSGVIMNYRINWKEGCETTGTASRRGTRCTLTTNWRLRAISCFMKKIEKIVSLDIPPICLVLSGFRGTFV